VDVGVGTAALVLWVFEEELPHDTENKMIAIAAKYKTFFIA
jgi:hypothetical protein